MIYEPNECFRIEPQPEMDMISLQIIGPVIMARDADGEPHFLEDGDVLAEVTQGFSSEEVRVIAHRLLRAADEMDGVSICTPDGVVGDVYSMPARLLTLQSAAEYLGIPEQKLHTAAKSGHLKTIRFDRESGEKEARYWVQISDLQHWLDLLKSGGRI